LFEVDVLGPLWLIRAVLPRLRGAGRGTYRQCHLDRRPRADGGIWCLRCGQVGDGRFVAVAGSGGWAFRDQGDGDSTRRIPHRFPDRSFDPPQRSRCFRAYAGTVGNALSYLDAIAGRQIGDPVRGAAAILAAVDVKEPPLHLLLGSDALRRAREKLDAMIEGIDVCTEVTRSTDFPEGTNDAT
jgi:hypothetical protein